MNYPDGTKMMIGDRLTLWEGCYGIVVCSIDDGEYTPEYPEEHWSYLRRGVLIDSNKGGLIHYTEPEDSFRLTARRSN